MKRKHELNLSPYIKDLTDKFGLTEKQIADRVKVSQTTISRLKNTDNAATAHGTAQAIYKLYGEEKVKYRRRIKRALETPWL